MFKTVIFYLGRALQLIGMAMAAFAIFVYFNQDGKSGIMLKWGFAGLVEFYVGYGLTALAGSKK
ncbi:hypothetical protein MNBD_NITROSPINAE01-1476 [hydrothermal vent metagenome]|uniref:Uncharacterized protein n=1 Tax=hydrothermal vent metagenome TaxID=652676 RepID=A0A3B1BUA6_9ZZZZ